MAGNDAVVSILVEAKDAASEVLKKVEADIKRLADGGSASVDRLSNAFKTLNIRSALDIDKDRANIISAFQQIANSGTASSAEVARAQQAMRHELTQLAAEANKVPGALAQVNNEASKSTGIMAGLGAAVGTALTTALMSAVGSIKDLATNTVDAALKMQQLEIQFKAISGNSALAKRDLDFVREASNRLGLSFTDTATGFASFAAAAKNSSMTASQTQQVFTGVSEAITAMHLPAEASSRIFTQMSQMMSKGTVAAEELKVVSESLPGTYDLVAKALGMTTTEMTKQMSEGKILANDVLPKLGAVLSSEFGEAATSAAGSAQAEFNRFKNQMFEVAAAVGESLLPSIVYLMKVFGGVVETIATVTSGFMKVYDALGFMGPVLATVAAGFAVWATVGPTITAVALAVAGYTAALEGSAAATLIYQGVSTAATAVTAAFNAVLALNPFILMAMAITAVVIGLTAWNAKSDEVSKDEIARKQKLAEAEEANRKRIKSINDEFEKAMGQSIDRQLSKRQEQLDKELKAVRDKYDMEIEAAKAAGKDTADLEAKQAADTKLVYEKAAGDKLKILQDEAKARTEHQMTMLKLEEKFASLTGDTITQLVSKQKQADLERKKSVEEFYNAQLLAAKDDVVATLAIEGAKYKALEDLAKQQSINPVLNGLALSEQRISIEKQATAERLSLLESEVRSGTLTKEQAAQREAQAAKDFSQQLLEIAKTRFESIASVYPKDSEEYLKAQKAKMDATVEFNNTVSTLHKATFAEYSVKYQKDVEEFKVAAQERLTAINTSEANQTSTVKEATAARTKLRAEEAKVAYDAAQKAYADAVASNQLTKTEIDKLYVAMLKSKDDYLAKTSASNRAAIAEETASAKASADSIIADNKVKNAELDKLYAQDSITKQQYEAQKLEIAISTAQQQVTVTQAAVDEAAKLYGTDSNEYKQACAEKETAAAELANAQKAATESAAEANKEAIAEEKAAAAALADFYSGVMSSAMGRVKDLSDEAYNSLMRVWESKDSMGTFNATLRETEGSFESYKKKLEAVRVEIGEMSKMHFGYFDSLSGWARDMELDGAKIQAAFLEQKMALTQMADAFDDVTLASEAQIAAAESSIDAMNLLDKSDLDNLKSKIQQAKDELQALRDMARDTLDALQDELDELNNNKVAMEDRAYQNRKLDLEEKLAEAEAAKDTSAIASLRKAMSVAEEIHKKKMANLEDERLAAVAAATASNSSSSGNKTKMNQGGQLPGGDSPMDTVSVLARPGEWFIRNESANFWGDSFMGAVNAPFSAMGQQLRSALAYVQKFASGGKVSDTIMSKDDYNKVTDAVWFQVKQKSPHQEKFNKAIDNMRTMANQGKANANNQDYMDQKRIADQQQKLLNAYTENVGKDTTNTVLKEFVPKTMRNVLNLTTDELPDSTANDLYFKSRKDILKLAEGGKLPGGDSPFDSVPVLARPGEWFIRNESAGFWGDTFMQAVNQPFSEAGKRLASALAGKVAQARFAVGGMVGTPAVSRIAGSSLGSSTTQQPVQRVEFVSPSGSKASGTFNKSDAKAMLDIIKEAGLRTA